jgi:hypothetical protein
MWTGWLLCALALAVGVAACGGDDEETASSTTSVAESGCGEVEIVEVEPTGDHSNREFRAGDYETNPPAGGDHDPTPLRLGRFYTDPPPLGESVHALEHGAVIGWTHELSAEDQSAVEDAFNELYSEGYEALAVVENPEMDVPFALSSWGAVQACGGADTEAIRPFVEEHYATEESAEGFLACASAPRDLPPCAET